MTKCRKPDIIINSYFLSVSYIAREIKFRLNANTPVYIKYGERVRTKVINAPNLIPQATTGQSIKTSGRKQGPPMKGYVPRINFSSCQVLYFHVANGPVPRPRPRLAPAGTGRSVCACQSTQQCLQSPLSSAPRKTHRTPGGLCSAHRPRP